MTSKCGPLSIHWHDKGHHWPQLLVFCWPTFPRSHTSRVSNIAQIPTTVPAEPQILPETGRRLTASTSLDTCNFFITAPYYNILRRRDLTSKSEPTQPHSNRRPQSSFLQTGGLLDRAGRSCWSPFRDVACFWLSFFF